uniref:Uncharacterized protein n=1 Tax=Rhizophora mucronata TaxID=61149 RepID=A0A2P2Q3R3_RHIMU
MHPPGSKLHSPVICLAFLYLPEKVLQLQFQLQLPLKAKRILPLITPF